MKLTVTGINRANGSIRAECRDERGTVIANFEGPATAHFPPSLDIGWEGELVIEAPPVDAASDAGEPTGEQ